MSGSSDNDVGDSNLIRSRDKCRRDLRTSLQHHILILRCKHWRPQSGRTAPIMTTGVASLAAVITIPRLTVAAITFEFGHHQIDQPLGRVG